MSAIASTKDLFVGDTIRLEIELPGDKKVILHVYQDIALGNLIELSKLFPDIKELVKNNKGLDTTKKVNLEVNFELEDLLKLAPKIWSILVKESEPPIKAEDLKNLKFEVVNPIFEKLFSYFAEMQEKTNVLANDDEEKKS